MKEASSATGGITINLEQLNKIELTDDKSIARLGTGNTWMKVYKAEECKILVLADSRWAAESLSLPTARVGDATMLQITR
jgi:FAD/FMN-containing dehydrogenase